MSQNRCETGCARCIMFAVDHRNTVPGWLKVAILFTWHRLSGECDRIAASLDDDRGHA